MIVGVFSSSEIWRRKTLVSGGYNVKPVAPDSVSLKLGIAVVRV